MGETFKLRSTCASVCGTCDDLTVSRSGIHDTYITADGEICRSPKHACFDLTNAKVRHSALSLQVHGVCGIYFEQDACMVFVVRCEWVTVC